MKNVDELVGDVVVKMTSDILSIGFLKYQNRINPKDHTETRRIIGMLDLIKILIRDEAKKRNNKKRKLARIRQSMTCQLRPGSYQTLMDKEAETEQQIKKYNEHLEKLYVQRDSLQNAALSMI